MLLNQLGQQFAPSDEVIMQREAISMLMLWFIGGSKAFTGFPDKIGQKLDLVIQHDKCFKLFANHPSVHFWLWHLSTFVVV